MADRNVRYAGFAEDPNLVNPQPQFYVDVSEVGMDSPSEPDMEVPSSIGMTSRAKRSGPYLPEGNVVYNTDIRTLGWFLKWGLMGYAFTAAPLSAGGVGEPPAGTPIGFNTHEIWANDLRYFTKICSRFGKDDFEHVFEHCTIGTVELAIERELVGLTASMSASKDFEGTLKNIEADIMPGLAEEYALSYHDVSLFIDQDGAASPIDVSDIAMSLTVSIENNVDAARGVTLGSRFSRRMGSSGRTVGLSTELDFKDMSQKRKFWGSLAATGPGKLGAMTFPVEARIDSGGNFAAAENYGDAVVRFPRCYYSAVPLTTSGREEISSGVDIRTMLGTQTLLDGTTEVATPMYVKLRNNAPMMAPPA